MKHDLPNETAAAGAHIGPEIWMVKWPSTSQGPVGLPSVVTFGPRGRLGMEFLICRGGGGGRGGRDSPCPLRSDGDVRGDLKWEQNLLELLASSPASWPRSRLSLLPATPVLFLPTLPLPAPALSNEVQHLRATENLALHVNYISGSLPRALQLSFHVLKKKKRYYAEIN